MRNFSDTQPVPSKQNNGPDRIPLKDGMLIYIQTVRISTETKYEKIAYLDGLNGKSHQPEAWYTTGKVIVRALESMLANDGNPAGGRLLEPTQALVKKVKGKDNGSYLILTNPGA